MKNKIIIITMLVTWSFSQELDENLTLEKKSLMVLPSSQDKFQEIAEKVISIISEAATTVGRFEVIDRTIVEDIVEEQAFQMSGMVSDDQVLELGELAAAEEALIVDIIHFGQKGVPKEKKEKDDDDDDDDDETLFSWVVKNTVKAAIDNTESAKEKRRLELENNILTVINTNVKLVNVKTGISENSFKLDAKHVGGNRDASLKAALSTIAFQANNKLKELYVITSEVIDVDGKIISILSGENLGLEEGGYFEIASRDKQKTYKGKTVTLPGKTRGLAQIIEVGPDASKAKIVRKWRRIKGGHRAYEMLKQPTAADFSILYSRTPHYNLTGKLLINPFNTLSGSLNGYLGFINDSRNDLDFYGGIGLGISIKLLSGFGTTLSSSLDLPFSFATRRDDKNHFISAGLFMPSGGLNIGVQIGKNQDLIFSVRNIFNNTKPNWTYSQKTGKKDEDGKDETRRVDAEWDDDKIAPTIDATGWVLSISLRRFWF
tara:strand:+ start:1782 stop:3248 length:1467 start_codon:yes stop_codon:yes gene_type:complete